MTKIPAILIIALLLGLVMRGWQAKERFLYAHDSDLASWMVKDIVVDKHLRLVGQETSAQGIFIGPMFYYSLIPFYLATNLDPVGSLAYSIAIGLVAIASLFFVINQLYGSRPAGIAALIYAGSELISRTEREVVPTTPVMLWSIWFYYAINLIFLGKKSGILLAAILLSLVWHINLALILLSPLIIVGIWSNRKRFSISDVVKPLIVLILLSLPLIIFELRHNFVQSHALFQTAIKLLSSGVESGPTFTQKVTHVLTYAEKNITHIFFTPTFSYSLKLIPSILTVVFLILLIAKRIPRYTGTIFVLWMTLYVLFFAMHPINLSEYYLNGMNIFWIIIAALAIAFIPSKIFSAIILCILITYNLNYFLASPINATGYIQKQALVNFIAEDAVAHGYPCVSVSYITDPGYNFGYRYFFFLKNLHVNQSISGSPVYSIVFPHKLVDRLDHTFGGLGLVLPDYSRYDESSVKISCSGANSNLTDPMFGFTK